MAAKSALAQFGQANALHKRAGDALYLRAIIELESNNIESAKPLLAEYLARHPDGRFKSNVERIQEQIRQMEAERPELPAVHPPAPRE